MDVRRAVRDYIEKLCNEGSGMKVLLLDQETTPIVSLVISQSEILQREVFLIDRLDKRAREKMPHLTALVLVRPTIDSIQYLVEELREPKYREYHLFFNNITRVVHIERLAEADQQALVSQVQEYFADVYPVNRDLFSLQVGSCHGERLHEWDSQRFDRVTEGLVALLLSLKKRPVVRYEASSDMAKRLAKELEYVMHQESQLFEFKQVDVPPLLLIVDRRNDPVTPLLSQWTYQAMIHELIGLKNCLLTPSEEISAANEDLRAVVLNPDQDKFFKENMFVNFGDLGANIKAEVDRYQANLKLTKKIDSIADMKKFVENYPEFKKEAGNVTKHVALVSELSKQVDKGALLEVSEIEQELAVNDDHSQNLRRLQGLLTSPKISEFNKVRLVLLYALRYEKGSNEVAKLIDILSSQGVSSNMISWISSIIRYAGASQRQGDLFQNENLFAKGKSALKKGLKGVENIYTQHVPLVMRTIEELLKGKLSPALYPFATQGGSQRANLPPHDIIIFFVGGVTYEEARFIHQFSESNTQPRIILGGTSIHNSASFLEDMESAIKRAK